MTKLKFLAIPLFFCLLYSLPAEAFWSTNWHLQKTYCGQIKSPAEKERCDKIWFQLNLANQLPQKKDDFEMCGKIFKYIKDIKPAGQWELANSCLELISYRRNSSVPKEQMKLCDWLLDNGKSVPRYIFCLQEFDQNALKVCDYPKVRGNYATTGNCLKYIRGIKIPEGSVQDLVNGCLKTNGGEDYLKRVTMAQWDSCLNSVTSQFESDSVINFETGTFTGTSR